jgi:hypothetical protein
VRDQETAKPKKHEIFSSCLVEQAKPTVHSNQPITQKGSKKTTRIELVILGQCCFLFKSFLDLLQNVFPGEYFWLDKINVGLVGA